MPKTLIRSFTVFVSIIFLTTSLSGCVAGDFGLTRTLGKWNRSFSVLPRVIIYIAFLIVPVYEITVLFDVILNNTIQFWTNTPLTNAKQETFERDGLRVVLEHSANPRRRTKMTSYAPGGQVRSVVEFRESDHDTIEITINGQFKGEVNSIQDGLVKVATYTGRGQQTFLIPGHEGLDPQLTQVAQARQALTWPASVAQK